MRRWLQMVTAALISACSLARAEQAVVEQPVPTPTPQLAAVETAFLPSTPPSTLIPPTAIPTVIPPTSTPNAQQQLLAQLPEFGRALELYNEVWLNTDSPLRLSELLGSVVLLDFWTFD